MKIKRFRWARRRLENWFLNLLPFRKQPSPARHLPGVYLRGHGVEIGALADPLRLPAGADVDYLDRYAVEDLRKNYPSLKDIALVPISIVCDGETLSGVTDESRDFIIARHFLEHCQDPIGTLKHFFRVLKPGGIAYIAIPDKRYTFDQARSVTSLEHLFEDHESGPQQSRRGHFEDYARACHHPATDEELQRQVDDLMQADFSIHYHVWTQHEFLELMLALRRRIGFEIECFCMNKREIIAVLRKASENLDPKFAESQNRALRCDRYSTSARSNGMLVSSDT